EIGLTFHMSPRMEARPGGLFCVRRGALLYALDPGERWEKREYEKNGVERRFPYCDYELFPTGEWNYAFTGAEFTAAEKPFDLPFSAVRPPVTLTATLTPIRWEMENGACTPQPAGRTPLGAAVEKELIPYGCTSLRMTEMPLVDKA
ncbi:MAG: hypothetical protein PHD32_11985, partial [Eubacteriales bacterium]|nr:hypothetical protein [Eubacteriales bacterium]